jgi:hypothetical protein
MKLSLLSAPALPLCMWCCCSVAAPMSSAVIDLTNVRTSMVSTIDGSSLPVTRRQSEWSLGNQVRSGARIDQHYAYQPNADFVHDLPVRVTSLLDSGSATVSIAQLYGDIHVAGAFDNYVHDEHVAYANAAMNAYFEVPGHAKLTLTGHLTVDSAGDPEKDFASFSALFAASGLVTNSFVLDRANTADQDFTITAVNLYDGPIGFYQKTSLDIFAFAPPSPVPEPPPTVLLTAGLLLAGWRVRRQNQRRLP